MMSLQSVFALLLVLSATNLYAIDVHVRPVFDEARLVRTAEATGYGYKYGNLDELQTLTSWFSGTLAGDLPKVEVPEFFGIKSSRIEQLLRDEGFDAAARWQAVVNTVLPEDRAAVIASKNIPDKFWQEQKNFVEDLELVLNGIAYGSEERSVSEFVENNVAADALIRKVLEAGDTFMVRSTGKEDTRKMANAGGNESIANVAATNFALWRAIKQVVLSYFGEKSLRQRLGLGDQSFFDPVVFCPVLVQRMIGEREGGEIPACGVMFTEEPEGGISMLEEGKTTGITLIQSARGHNEGVVNSKVAVDTYIAQMVDGEPVFYPTIRAKWQRLKPESGGSGELEIARNSKKDALAPALNHKMLVVLKKFSNELERFYGYPVDVEFVVRDSTIWIVQARPIVHREELRSREPSYINLDKFAADAIVPGRTIVGFGGMVTPVKAKENCVINARIGAALDEYLYRTPDQSKVIVALSGSDAPSTSHEATTFRNEGKLVMYLPEVKRLEDALNQGKQLLVSPQQQCVVIVDDAERIPLIPGWCNYPLPRELSLVSGLYENIALPIAGAAPVAAAPVAAAAAGPGIASGMALSVAGAAAPKLEPSTNPVDLKGLLDIMKRVDFGLVPAAQEFPKQILKKFPIRRLVQDADLKLKANQVLRVARLLCQRIERLSLSGASKLEILLPIRYLEALVYQQGAGEAELQYSSVAVLNKTLKQENISKATTAAPVARTVKADSILVQLKKASVVIFDPKTQYAWNGLLNAIHNDAVSLQTLGRLVAELNSLEILPFWLHSIMYADVSKSDSAGLRALIARWVADYESDQESFNRIKELKRLVMELNVARFADPKEFDAAWAELQEIKTIFLTSPFTEIFKSEGLVLIAAVDLLQKFINVFDISIKTGSALWRKEEKPVQFQAMLQEFLNLLRQLVSVLPERKVRGLEAKNATLEKYLEMMDKLINQELSPRYLDPSSDFDASPFAMGAGHDWVTDKAFNQQPATGEDGYTLIHKSLINLCSRLMVTDVMKSIPLPSLLKSIEKVVTTAFSTAISERFLPAQLTGVMFDQAGIVRVYNIPLGCHSIQIDLKYNKKAKNVVVGVRFFGGLESEFYRWSNTAALFAYFYALNKFDGSLIKIGINELSLEIIVKNDKESLAAFKDFFAMVPPLVKSNPERRQALEAGRGESLQDGRFRNFSQSMSLDDPTHLAVLLALHNLINNRDEEALSLAEKGIASPNEIVATEAMHLLKSLEGEIPPKSPRQEVDDVSGEDLTIHRMVRLAAFSQHKLLHLGAIQLYESLLEKGAGVDEIKAHAAEMFDSSNPVVRLSGLRLYKILVDKEIDGIKEVALVVAQKSILGAANQVPPNSDEYFAGIELFRSLLDRDYGFDDAVLIVQNLMFTLRPLSRLRPPAIKLCEKLVEKSKRLDDVVLIASQASAMSSPTEIKAGLSLFEALIEKGVGFSEAIKAGLHAMHNPNPIVQIAALGLFEKLISRGFGFSAAIQAVIISSKASSQKIKELGLQLKEKLNLADNEIALIGRLNDLKFLPRTKGLKGHLKKKFDDENTAIAKTVLSTKKFADAVAKIDAKRFIVIKKFIDSTIWEEIEKLKYIPGKGLAKLREEFTKVSLAGEPEALAAGVE
jgi:hypothetical protein